MNDFVILLDSTADLDREFSDQYGIEVILAHFAVNGVEHDAFLNWDTVSREDFYTALKADPDAYTTSPPSVGEMAAAMERFVAEGKPVLYLTISSGISGALGFAEQAKAIVTEKYPDAAICCFDSLRFGPAIGLMAIHASQMRAKGMTYEEVIAALTAARNGYHQAGWLDDLSFVAKKGRITHAKAFFGTLVGVKPIGEFDYNGLTTVLGKAKGEKAAYEVLLAYIKATVENPEEQIIFIAQTNRRKQAEKYKQMIEETFHPKAVYIKDVYPCCGINVGPGLMAAYYTGKPISADLSVERDLIKQYLGG